MIAPLWQGDRPQERLELAPPGRFPPGDLGLDVLHERGDGLRDVLASFGLQARHRPEHALKVIPATALRFSTELVERQVPVADEACRLPDVVDRERGARPVAPSLQNTRQNNPRGTDIVEPAEAAAPSETSEPKES